MVAALVADIGRSKRPRMASMSRARPWNEEFSRWKRIGSISLASQATLRRAR